MTADVVRHRKMPRQKPNRSRQDYATPWDFIEAVERRFGKLEVDLAATKANAKAPWCVTPEQDSLSISWAERFADKLCWLNPPFGNIEKWAAKCAQESEKFRKGRILFLTPASVGARWFERHVHNRANVLTLLSRLTFVGEDQSYPKDLMLSVYGRGALHGFDTWDWRTLLETG